MHTPKLHPLQAIPLQDGDRIVVQLFDPSRLSDQVAIMPQEMMFLLAMLDGTHSIVDIQAAITRQTGEIVFAEQIQQIIDQLDQALFLESPHFADHMRQVEATFRAAPVRPATSAGSGYPANPQELATALDSYFTAPGGPGKPAPAADDGRLVGLVAPHIDFARGGPTYAHAYNALRADGLAEGCDADLFVVLGTAHHARDAHCILTRKDFETPLGTMPTATALVDQLARQCDGDLFAEELVHAKEHSIEFQVVLLQHILGDHPAEILPILCCSTDGRVDDDQSPRDLAKIGDFLAALDAVITDSGRQACVIASADLAHVGRHFGDEFALTPDLMQDVEAADRDTLAHAVRLDAEGFYDAIRIDDNARHICGVAPIYTLLATTPATRATLLDYRQAVDYDLDRAVTFAAMALYA